MATLGSILYWNTVFGITLKEFYWNFAINFSIIRFVESKTVY